MRLFFVSSELAPLCQSGGLGDAVSGLARALGGLGHEVTCVLPGYQDVMARYPEAGTLVDGGEVQVALAGGAVQGRFWMHELFPGVQVAFCALPGLFDRPGLYGDGERIYDDNPRRFIALSRAAAYRAEQERPDVLVAHDHHAAMTLATLKTSLARGLNKKIGCVQVVHNNAYQGRTEADAFADTGLAPDLFHHEGVESWGELNLLKAGVAFADRIVAVSETYAREIQGGQMGEGLEGVYRARGHRLLGIPNGIDTVRFDPACDDHLPAHFTADRLEGKTTCRAAVLDELRLEVPAPGRFAVAIGRFAEQKGWDVLAAALPELVQSGGTVAILGDGDPHIASELAHLARRFPDRISVRNGYDGGLARRLYAGGDCVLIPSRFEPCGLVQLIAQRYGTVPVAHAVGGLVDTIHDPGFPGSGAVTGASGMLFAPLGVKELVRAVARVAALGEEGRLEEMQQRLMRIDVSWETPAMRWSSLLEDVAEEAAQSY